MNYINPQILDLDLRLNQQIIQNKDCYVFSAQIHPENTKILINTLKSKNMLVNINNITSMALRLYFERYRKYFKISVKHCLIAIIHTPEQNTIYYYGVVFTSNPQKLADLWQYGVISIEPLTNKIGFIKKYIRIFNQNKFFKKPYISPNFGSLEYEINLQSIDTITINPLENEFFKPIPFYEGYFISNYSRVISKKHSKQILLKIQKNQFHLNCVTLSKNAKQKKISLATLMAKTFLNLDFQTLDNYVYHIDGNLDNNHLTNLVIKQRFVKNAS